MVTNHEIKLILKESRRILKQSSIIHLPMFLSIWLFLPIATLIKSNTIALFGLLKDLPHPVAQIIGTLWLSFLTYLLISMVLFLILISHCLVIVMVVQYPDDCYKSLRDSAQVVIHKMGEVFLFYMLIEFLVAVVFFIHIIPAILILYFFIFTMISMFTEKIWLHTALMRNVEVIKVLTRKNKPLLLGLVLLLTFLVLLTTVITFLPPVSQIPSVFIMSLFLNLTTVVLIKIYKHVILLKEDKRKECDIIASAV